jgi:hypothetical protein
MGEIEEQSREYWIGKPARVLVRALREHAVFDGEFRYTEGQAAKIVLAFIDAFNSERQAMNRLSAPYSYDAEARETIQALEAELARVREAAGPVAELAGIKLVGEWRDDESIESTDLAWRVKFGHLRALARAVKGEG